MHPHNKCLCALRGVIGLVRAQRMAYRNRFLLSSQNRTKWYTFYLNALGHHALSALEVADE